MAITKVFAIRGHFEKTVQYVVNEKKTVLDGMIDYAVNPDKTEQRLYESQLNCNSVKSAGQDMERTKRRNNKLGGVQGYHIIQSFKPGELTPEQTHEIGIEFARRLFVDRFEVVIGTLLDKHHLHNHIAVNSVSFRDGSKLRINMKTYYQEIQKVSDDLCREYGLSVIQPKGRGKSHPEWQAEKNGQPTIREQVRRDIDGIICRSLNFTTFLEELRKAGYEIRSGNRKHTSIKPPYGKKYIRLDSLGENYTDADIERRIMAQRTWGRPPKLSAPQHCVCRGNLKKCHKARGFRALYFHYVYLLRGAVKGYGSKKVSRYLLEDTVQFEKYLAQHRLLAEYRIETAEDLQAVKCALTEQINIAVLERKPLYDERRKAYGEQKEALSQEIGTRTSHIRQLRRDLRLCQQIEADEQRVHTRVHHAQMIKEDRYNEPRQRSRRTNDTRSYPDLRGSGKAGGAGSQKSCGNVSGTGQRESEAERENSYEYPASQR